MTDLIAKHLAHITSQGLSSNTIQDRGKVLQRLDRDLPMGLQEATVDELADWLAGPTEPPVWSAQTRATYRGHVVGFFRWACDPHRPYLDWDPSASLPRPKVPQGIPHPCTDEELAAILSRSSAFWNRLAMLAAYAGLRCCELATIDRRDINDDRLIVVGKGGKERAIPTAPQIWQVVEPLPPGPIAKGLDPDQVSRIGIQVIRRADVDRVTLHWLRHWFASTLLDQGVDIRVVQELLGHSSVATTAIYTRVSSRQREMAIRTLPTLAPVSA